MHDPIGSFERVRDLYLTYLETAFRIKDDGVSHERRELLERPSAVGKATDTLATPPLVEPVPRYAPVTRAGSGRGLRLDHLVGDDGADLLPGFSRDERLAFVDLALAGLFESSTAPDGSRQADFPPLRAPSGPARSRRPAGAAPASSRRGRGRARRRRFLLPIFAQIAREAAAWPAPRPRIPSAPLVARGRRVSGLTARASTPAVQRPSEPLVLYPMNALVEDQLTRIRKALDSPGSPRGHGRAVRRQPHLLRPLHERVPRHQLPRPPPTGQRRGQAPQAEAGRPRRRQWSRPSKPRRPPATVTTRLRRPTREGRGTPPTPPGTWFPSTDGAELLSRWDVQQTPPDLLVTNTSMLSAMLVREVDAPLFETTRAWIESDPDAYFYLVLDELHLQRGSAGTEVAYLLRVLLERLGLTQPEHRHKLRVLGLQRLAPRRRRGRAATGASATSTTSLARTGSTAPAARRPRTARRPGTAPSSQERRSLQPPEATTPLDPAPFDALVGAYGRPDQGALDHPSQHEDAWRTAAAALGLDSDGGLQGVVVDVILEAGARVAAACTSDADGGTRATPVPTLAQRLFQTGGPAGDRAVRGLLVARGAGDAVASWWPDDAKPLAEHLKAVSSFRVHTFFRAIEGLFAAPDEADAVAAPFRSPGRTVGPLSIERGERFAERADGPGATGSRTPLLRVLRRALLRRTARGDRGRRRAPPV